MKIRAIKSTLNLLYLKSLLAFSLVTAIIIAGLYGYISTQLDGLIPPDIADLDSYSDQLSRDAFNEIPLQKFKSCSFMVLDEKCNTIYRNNWLVDEVIDQDDLEYIEEYNQNSALNISRINTNGNEQYFVSKTSYSDDGIETINGYAILDKNYNMLSGSLFGGKKAITPREFEILTNNLSKKYYITKYSYQTQDGLARVLVFFAPQLDMNKYDSGMTRIENIWLWLIPIFTVVIIISAFLIGHKTKSYLKPLNNAILGFTHNQKSESSQQKGPYEFIEIAKNFDYLVKQLNAAEEDRQKSDAEKQKLITDISHDLKTPITVIQGFAKAIHDGVIAPEDKPRYEEIIYRKSGLLAELIDTFFEYNKIEHPDFRANREPTDIHSFCRDYFAEKYQEIQCCGFQLSVDIPDSVLQYPLDSKLFTRVLNNLVENALKYNPKGTTIFFSIKNNREYLTMTVADNGVGIPKEIANTIFDPFVVGDTSRGNAQGSGLGMAIVKKIIDCHNGNIRLIESEYSKYSTEFEIVLPLNDLK